MSIFEVIIHFSTGFGRFALGQLRQFGVTLFSLPHKRHDVGVP